jgi:hypothetical protein
MGSHAKYEHDLLSSSKVAVLSIDVSKLQIKRSVGNYRLESPLKDMD